MSPAILPLMPPLHLLHFADLHVGMENYGRLDPETGISSRIKDFLDRLDEVVEYALTHEADLVLFAGDAFKTRDPDPTQQREFARRIKRLAKHCPVFMLVGNHDIPGMAAKATSVEIFSTLEVENVTVGRLPGAQVFQTKSGPLFLAWMPFPMRHRLLANEDYRGASVEELDRRVAELIMERLNAFTAEAAAQDMPRVLTGHFSVEGAMFGSERSVMLGRDLVVPLSGLNDAAWDYVALGHIHKHQNLTHNEPGWPPVVYPGSLERIDFGEAHDPKGFCWLTLERDHTQWEFVPVQARPFYSYHVDARAANDPTNMVLDHLRHKHLTGAVVKLTIQLTEQQETLLRRRDIEQALSAAAYMAGITLDVERATRLSQLTDTLHKRAESLTPYEWTDAFLTAKQPPPESERLEKLLQLAQELLVEN